MKIGSILVAVDFDRYPQARVALALDLAARFGARLIGFSAADLQIPVVAMDAPVSAELINEEHRDIETGLADLKSAFLKQTKGTPSEWRSYVGPPNALLARDARGADLIVTGAGQGGSLARTIDPGALALDAGRPLLVVPEDCDRLVGERVLVAWKDTREARRAVHDALPFLAAAKDVLIVTVDEPEIESVKASFEDVSAMLDRHGIAARTEIVDPTGGHTGQRLVEAASAMRADLIVSGAYGHSRLREWVFGGVTRSLLASQSPCRLISN